MSTSHYSSRPAQNDVGADTIRIPLSQAAPNRRRRTRATQLAWLAVGVALLLADGTAMYRYADSALESVCIALLTMPTGILVILAALQVRK
jgi:hypothetical protein